MPATLTENGFFTTYRECALMLDDTYREKIAQAHVQALLDVERDAV